MHEGRWPLWKGEWCNKHLYDLWNIGELLHSLKPRVFIECGTGSGGSTQFFADILWMADNQCRIVTIDILIVPGLNDPWSIYKIRGDSLKPWVFDEVKYAVDLHGGPIMVDLDSDHSTEHVLAELELYAPLVTVGSYVIVEDTNHIGPREAVEKFLPTELGRCFEVDWDRCNKFPETYNPGGYLRRVK